MNETETISREAMHKILKSGEDYDWLQHLNKDEFAPTEKGKVPLLHGLQRLANIRGIQDMTFENLKIATFNSKKFKAEVPIVLASVRIKFNDGQVVANAADCHMGNCSDLGHFPTAVAASRAIARALSDAFNIKHVKEELDPMTADDAFGDPDTKITDMQSKGIKAMAKMRKLDVVEQIQALFPEKEDSSLESLTNGEATRLMAYVNNGKV